MVGTIIAVVVCAGSVGVCCLASRSGKTSGEGQRNDATDEKEEEEQEESEKRRKSAKDKKKRNVSSPPRQAGGGALGAEPERSPGPSAASQPQRTALGWGEAARTPVGGRFESVSEERPMGSPEAIAEEKRQWEHGQAEKEEEATGETPTSSAFQVPDHYRVMKKLGTGAYGEVFLCYNELDGTEVAVKKIGNFTRDPVVGKRILREVKLLAELRHNNLLHLCDILPVPNPDFEDVYLVTPYMHVDLHRLIHSKVPLVESQSRALIIQILRGLNYLHSAGVMHRDLKPSNVLVNRDVSLRIADFGLARARSIEDMDQLTDYVVTRWYRAPELVLLPTAGYFEAVDLWSVGCIFAELMGREPLFPGKNHLEMLRMIANTLGFSADTDLGWVPERDITNVRRFLNSIPPLPSTPVKSLEERLPDCTTECLDLIHRLLDKLPQNRISAADAICHPYLASLRNPAAEAVAEGPFKFDFDRFEPTRRALKDRLYAECVKYHPEIVERDVQWIQQRGFQR
jgi:mitogen-activated protein kinase 1/3